MSVKNIQDVAKVIRSKNCSPFELTLDIILKEVADYEAIKQKNLVNKEVIAQLYRIPLSHVQKVIYFDCAQAIKITMRRAISSGAPGDTDVYGAQQHGPLFNLNFDY